MNFARPKKATEIRHEAREKERRRVSENECEREASKKREAEGRKAGRKEGQFIFMEQRGAQMHRHFATHSLTQWRRCSPDAPIPNSAEKKVARLNLAGAPLFMQHLILVIVKLFLG